jgi:hypothetical protein
VFEGLVVRRFDDGDQGDDNPRQEPEAAGDQPPDGPGNVIVDHIFSGFIDLGDGVLFDQPENQWPEDLTKGKHKTRQGQKLQIEPPIVGVWRGVWNLGWDGVRIHRFDVSECLQKFPSNQAESSYCPFHLTEKTQTCAWLDRSG